MFEKPHAVPPIFCLNVQTDYYNGHPWHFGDELSDYLGWIQLGAVSPYGTKDAFSWKILIGMISYLIKVEKFWNYTQINKISPGTFTDTHLDYINTKLSKCIKMLIKTSLLTLYYTFVYPHFWFCIHVWGRTCQSYFRVLEVTQKKLIRLIYFF